ncbi:MAG: sigma-70 family RNA polymerase sigma factor [Verrucomicrobiota bacterium]|nr:sigma-70 family RNA polymerase sigma factor [Verrucomicrobiota bacterium]
MPEPDDIGLLGEYARRQSEDAFAALVERHVVLVYSVALRSAGNPQTAEEITQAVFIILARKARSLPRRTVLSGWLYQTARLTAANFLRAEIRRQKREQEAYMQSRVNEPEPEVWPQIVPLLDAAMERLGKKDRDAIVLRYFENKNLREVGAALGASEGAARMRVARALERLRKFFTRRGMTHSADAIAGAVLAHSVHAAPIGLAKTITAVALAKGAAAGGSTLTLVKGALKLMEWTKAKTAVVAGIGVLAVAGITTIIVKDIDAHRVYDWQTWADQSTLNKAPPQATIRPAPASRHLSDAYISSGGKMEGLGYDFREVVLTMLQIDPEHLIVTAPLPSGKFDYIANFAAPGGDAYERNCRALINDMENQFGLAIRPIQVETNVLFLRVQSAYAPGLKPNSDAAQNGPVITRTSFSSHGGIWMLVQSLEVDMGTVVVDQTGLSGHYDINLKWNGTADGLEQALREELGLELVSSDKLVTVPMYVVEKVK